MRARIFAYVPITRALRHGVPGPNPLFASFVPGLATLPGTSVIGDRDGDSLPGRAAYGALQSQYDVWRNLLRNHDYVGFEHGARPLFIDPMLIERLRADFPGVAKLRETMHADHREAWLAMTPDTAREHTAMRAAFTDADHARVTHWLSRLDIALTPSSRLAGDARRQMYFAGLWSRFVEVARQFGIFRAVPEELMMQADAWPWFNSFIMRADLFDEFASACFEALFAFERIVPRLMAANIDLLAERLLGVFLHDCYWRSPLQRVALLPVLVTMPEQAPLALPEDFDPATYLVLNPDVAAAGVPADRHFLTHGWRETRDWVQ